MHPQPDWLEELEHTADVGIRVRAPDPCTLFARAAWGLFSLIADPATVRPRAAWPVTVEAPDREALLQRWLAELNFRHQTERLLFGRFDVDACTDRTVKARVAGEPIGPRHVVRAEIKAVTFHELRVEETTDGWRAQVIFDV